MFLHMMNKIDVLISKAKNAMTNTKVDYHVQGIASEIQRDITNLMSSSNVNYRGDFSDSISYEIELGKGNVQFGKHAKIRFYSDRSIAPHEPFVSEGSSGSRFSTFIPPKLLNNVTEWAQTKLGADKIVARRIAYVIWQEGAQSSPNSNLRGLPPEGQQGYDPFLHYETAMPDAVEGILNNYGRIIEASIREALK